MELRVVKKEGNKLVLELVGEDHTLANVLSRTLLKDPSVRFAAYRIDHPLVSNPVLIVVTDGTKTPIKAIGDAIDVILKHNEEFRRAFEEAIASYKEATSKSG